MTTKGAKDAGVVSVQVAGVREDASATITGADPNKPLMFNIAHAGVGTEYITVDTDDSGSATVGFVPQSSGLYSVSVTTIVHTDDIAPAVEVTVP